MHTDIYLQFGRSWNSSLIYYIRPAEYRAESLALVSWFYPCLRIATEDFAVITHPFALSLGSVHSCVVHFSSVSPVTSSPGRRQEAGVAVDIQETPNPSKSDNALVEALQAQADVGSLAGISRWNSAS